MFIKVSFLVCLLLSVVGCGGGGGDDEDSNGNTFALSGSVPGTLIEVFGENGSYYKSVSTNDGTSRHPFLITLKQGVAYYLFMTVNENTPQSITTPIKFSADGYRFTANANTTIDLGYVPLYKTRGEAAGHDADADGVLDSHYQIDANGLTLLIKPTAGTTWDSDNDGIHNKYDNDFIKSSDDNDGDGVPNPIDINPNNNNDNRFNSQLDRDNDGYLDEDRDRDGYYDDDHDRDGYHDDDNNKDGYHDDDDDKDGYHDDDKDHDGINDDDGAYSEVKGTITAINGALITMNVTKREHTSIPLGSLVVNTANAYFEHTNLASLSVGYYIEAKGVYNITTRQLVAYKVERD